jgi:hypothetical protein
VSEPSSPLTFAAALRAEIDAVVARYEALARAHEETLSAVRARESDALGQELAVIRVERDRLRIEAGEQKAEIATLRAEIQAISRDLEAARGRASALEGAAREAGETARALSEQFAAEDRFVTACAGLDGSLLGEALKSALGREIAANPATYAALKGRGLEIILSLTFKERGRSVVQAPLLERERAALPGLAAAAGCELVTPTPGTRFAATSMDKASSVSQPAEEGNVVECLIPGARRSGTEGALVLPRVVVATG